MKSLVNVLQKILNSYAVYKKLQIRFKAGVFC